MEKKKIVIASILKPVNDTRSFEKIGLTLSQTNKYVINIIGFHSNTFKTIPNINFYPIFRFKRTDLKRLMASWKYYKLLIKVKPDIIIVSTPELLIVSVLFRIIFGTKLCYDVQENYYRNIRYTPTYPFVIRTALANLVKFVEYVCSPWIDQYFLAESCYLFERNFPGNKSKVLLNKFKPLLPIKRSRPGSELPKIRFLYTGTIASNYGIFEAIHLAKNISIIYPHLSLKIIGFAPDPSTLSQVKKTIKQHDFIELISGSAPIPHQEIIDSISEADFALLPYQPDKSIENCFPTKIWEYMAHGLPMIIQNHAVWVNYCNQYQSCVPIDFKNYSPEALLKQLFTLKFYSLGIPEDIFWHSEELTLLKAIQSL